MATPIYAPHLFPENAEAKYNEFMMRIATCVYARNGETAWLYGTDNLVGYLNELCDYGPYTRSDEREVERLMLELQRSNYRATEDDYYDVPIYPDLPI